MKINIGGVICDSIKEPDKCIEKMWDHIKYLEREIGDIDSDDSICHRLDNRIDELECKLTKFQEKLIEKKEVVKNE